MDGGSSLIRVAHIHQFFIRIQDLFSALVVFLRLVGQLSDTLQCEWRSTC